MSHSATQASAFFRDVAKTRRVWTVRCEGRFPALMTRDGKRAQPFWSSLSRVKTIIESVPAYADFEPHEIDWTAFSSQWVPTLARDGILLGVNWFGKGATGYDIEPERVRNTVESYIAAIS